MSVIRLGRFLFRSFYNILPDVKASGRVPAKPLLNSRSEFRDAKSIATELCASRSPQIGNGRCVSSIARQFSNGFTARPLETDQQSVLKLEHFEVGERLGESSSCAAVYAAKNKDREDFAKEWQVLSLQEPQNSSNSLAGPTYRNLPPHPNVCPVLCAFADNTPCLPDARNSYSAALPRQYGEGCFGRNRTMFFVMPRLGYCFWIFGCITERYNKTVREFIARNGVPDEPVAILLMLQLLQGISHITRHGIAHRDLKADNLLLDETTGDWCPQLVIADFGCCLADRQWGLKLPFITGEISRGGNCALMAPEIACAVPGENSFLDYSKSDAWAGGAISYELFGARNPFEGGELDSRTYQDEHLPLLCRAQPMVRKVVSWLLKRDPSERVTADMAAIMLAVVLWAPAEWLQPNSQVSVTDINRWLFDLSYRILTCTGTATTENKIQCQFLSSATAADVVDALELLREETI
ncbi:Serine/threonine-protein kinase Pink1 [Acropora cervicornis]|uniref:non-specific serine/threonine protein kinase n=1 Tax=Acropora cervicornis TaxID=6130 RepID=A0AAD9QTN3_ACRCE|nr:Serine/threonine-protein kinase Pink1 [Acropora cervicornis]